MMRHLCVVETGPKETKFSAVGI